MKTCIVCKQEFPGTLEYFHKHRKSLKSYCKTCSNKINKQWQKANPEKVKAKNNVWRKANRTKANATSSAWHKANPSSAIKRNHKRKALKLGNGFEEYSHEQIFKLYGTNCYLCDMPINLKVSGKSGSNPQWRSGLHIEHFIDIALGGPDTLENVRPSHAWCNLTKAPKINN